MEHTTLLYIIYSSHILIFSFQICTYQTCTHIIVYIIYCVFAILYIAYLYICILYFYYLCPVLLLSFFFCYQQFFYFIFSHTTQHNIQNTTKQNNRHILNISRSNQKGGGEGRTTRTQKLLLYIITYIQQKTLPSINGRRPGPTNSRRCTFT